jgi:hypothetical protein
LWLALIDRAAREDESHVADMTRLVMMLFGPLGMDAAVVAAEAKGLDKAAEVLMAAGARHPLACSIVSAAWRGDASEVRRLLDSVPPTEWTRRDAGRRGFDADNILSVASREGHEEVVSLLLERRMGDKDRALVEAASCGRLGVVRLLVERGADPHRDDESAMRAAVEGRHAETARYLADAGCDVWRAIEKEVEKPAKLF